MNKSIFPIKLQYKTVVFISVAALLMPLSSAPLLATEESPQPGMETGQRTEKAHPEQGSQLPNAYKTSELLGKTVKNSKGEDLGEINEVVIDQSGQVKYAVLSHGGVLGMGADMTAVSWKMLQLSPEKDHYVLNIDITPKQLSEAPTFSEDSWPTEAQLTEFSAFETREVEGSEP